VKVLLVSAGVNAAKPCFTPQNCGAVVQTRTFPCQRFHHRLHSLPDSLRSFLTYICLIVLVSSPRIIYILILKPTMPVAPAIKGVLIASSLVAAAVAAYETNPNVRDFVDSTTYKAQLALEDFLENLEAEFNPDPHARLRTRQRQREMRAQAMGASASGSARRGSRSSECGARGVNIVITGSESEDAMTATARQDATQQSQELRRRHIGYSEQQAETDNTSTASNSTFFSQPASTSAADDLAGLSLANDPDEEDIEVVDRELDAAETVSSEDLLELDPFADPLTPLPVLHDEEVQEEPHTPTSFTTYSGSGENILTPRTPRTPATQAGDVSDSYFDDFEGREGEHGVVLEGAPRRARSETAVSVQSGVSSVGFKTPDEDEDEEDWGRTLD